jgi:hypothetical protein
VREEGAVVLAERENIEIVKPCWKHLKCAVTVGIIFESLTFNLTSPNEPFFPS